VWNDELSAEAFNYDDACWVCNAASCCCSALSTLVEQCVCRMSPHSGMLCVLLPIYSTPNHLLNSILLYFTPLYSALLSFILNLRRSAVPQCSALRHRSAAVVLRVEYIWIVVVWTGKRQANNVIVAALLEDLG